MPMYWAIVLKTSLLLRGFGPLFYAVRLFGLAFRPSFSSIASTTKHDVVRHAVQLEAPVKLFRNAGRQLRQGFVRRCHQAAFFFDPGGRPGPRRRLRRR